MKTRYLAASLAALSFATADLALAQGKGNGDGNGRDKGGHEQGGPGKAADKGRGPGRGDRGGKAERAEAKAERRGPDRRPVDVRALRDDRGPDRRVVIRDDRRDVRRDERSDVVVVDRRGDAARGDRIVFRVADRRVIAGCPPGLAKKNNGCLPPGQAKKAWTATRYDDVWNRWNDDYDYRYDNGYVYRLNSQGGLLGYLPVLGGALGLGQLWPAQYTYDPAPDYYSRYYGLPDRYQYRYADGALFGLDPNTQMISQVAALLTGQQWNVGQPMPAGYDIYNVPYDYRSRYVDSAQSLYRYSDGYVYQVDPTTRLVQAVIQLLT